MFTRCQETCPIQTSKLAALQRQCDRWPDWKRVRLVSITVDPEYDTGAVLERYAESYRANLDQWKFLTGSREKIWKLCKEGFKLPVADSPNEKSPIVHSARFMLVDETGSVRGIYDSQLDKEVKQLVIDLRHLLEEKPDPQTGVTHLLEPKDLLYTPWLDERRATQLATSDQVRPRHDFSFRDALEESGITFVSRAVGDAARYWKMNHYDHANGIVGADVDSDGLLDLYFLSQIGGCELWRNLGMGKFENVTERAGLAIPDRVVVSASFADTDNDGDPDLYITTTRHGNLFFVNDGTGRFQDATQSAGLTYVGHSSTAEFFDYDRDGKLDLFVTNVGRFTTDEISTSGSRNSNEGMYYVGDQDAFAGHLHPDRDEMSLLYHNDGGNQFRNVTTETGLIENGWNGDATPCDLNQDGWIDLYVLNMQGSDQYWENEEGKRFVNRTKTMLKKAPWGGMGVKSFDYDNDSRMDLIVTNMHVDMWSKSEGSLLEKQKAKPNLMPSSYLRKDNPNQLILGNALFHSLPDGTYEEVSDKTNTEMYWPWGLSTGDLNADGWQDLFVTASMNLKYPYFPNAVLLNSQGERFDDAEFLLGVEPRANQHRAVPWYELDCSGVDATHPAAKGRTGRIVVWGAVGSRSSLIVDLDGDGDLDIVTADFHSAPQILLSDLAQRDKELCWAEIALRGTKSNRDGLGARVTVTTAAGSQTQTHDGQSGYLSQSQTPLYFGLANEVQIDQIEVVWPSGTVQKLSGPVMAKRRIVIVEE